MSAVLVSLVSKTIPTLGARGFSCAVSGFGQVLKVTRAARLFSLWTKTCRSTTDEAPRHTQEKTSGTQGRLYPGSRDLFSKYLRWNNPYAQELGKKKNPLVPF